MAGFFERFNPMKLWISFLRITLRPWPRSFVRSWGKLLGFLWFDLFRFRRKVVMDNLTKAFPEWTEEKKVSVGRKSVYMLMENLFEFFLIPLIDEKWLAKNVVFTGMENIDLALKEKKGVLLLSLHLGHGDMLANCFAKRGYKVSLITKFFNNKFLNALWFSIRGAQGVEHIPPHGEKTPFMILKALKANATVGFVLDQHMGKPFGIKTEFFGHSAGTAYGLALFHLKTKSPVVPLYTFQDKSGKIHIVAEPAFKEFIAKKGQDRDQTLVELTQCYTSKIEEIVRQYPEQWMWVHRRWKWKGT